MDRSRPPAAPADGALSLEGARVLIVEARYYDEIADELLAGARAALTRAGCDVTVRTVPGALEIPTAVATLCDAAERERAPYEAVVALGCVIRGETGHYDIVAGESARALMDLSVWRRLPLGNGILTVNSMDQALARARVSEMDKGGGAADAALALLRLAREGRAAADARPTVGFGAGRRPVAAETAAGGVVTSGDRS